MQLARAEGVVPRKRIVVVVAEEHRPYWARTLADLLAESTVVQPSNRGTAAGILLPLLHVLARDPEARVVLLPSDHHVEQECVVQTSLHIALDALGDVGGGAILLGITPDAPETGYGWIVPLQSRKLVQPVARFEEKPDRARASELRALGALWNSFLVVAEGRSILSLYERRLPALLERLRSAFVVEGPERAARLRELYAGLEVNDFSRDVLERSEDMLRLLPVPPCGWTDLGTPSRVKSCLASLAALVPGGAEDEVVRLARPHRRGSRADAHTHSGPVQYVPESMARSADLPFHARTCQASGTPTRSRS